MGFVLFEHVCACMYGGYTCVHTYITDEGSRRIPTCVKIVNLSASVNKPQSCTYVCMYVGWYANNLHSYRLFCACVCLCFCVFVC